MSRDAPRVHVDPVAVARLEQVAVQLPQDTRVEVELDDGSRLRGMVSMTPTVQSFFDADGREGLNGVARIECESDAGVATGHSRYLWLDRIGSVAQLPNPTPPEPSTRIPPD
ncbi:MAG: DUF3247 family protein, partial [Pseudomonadota bacterium]|nr:DUF3247 family protein [Pseudomonadota bacterium]